MPATPQAGASRTRHRRLRVSLSGLCTVLTLLTALGSARADCAKSSILPYRWCGLLDIPVWWGENMMGCGGSGPDALDCQRWRAAVRAVMQEFNPGAAIELDTPLFLFEAGDWDGSSTGIVIRRTHNGLIDCFGGSFDENLGQMEPHAGGGTGGSLDAMQYAEITFNMDVPWDLPDFHRTSVARHEMMHALGVGHSSGGTCLMSTTLPCNTTRTIDESVWAPLRCLYGDPFGSCTGAMGVAVKSKSARSVKFKVGNCSCVSAGCPSPKMAQPSTFSYEFAVSESGGPFVVFATLDPSTLVDNEYTYDFTQDYQSAMVRLQQVDGATVLDEAFILAPISIAGTTTAAPPLAAPQPPLLVSSAPNPFGTETQLSFALRAEQSVEVVLFDAAGRRVRTLQSGTLGAGQHQITWDGRLENGAPAASGIYHCQVRTNSGTTTRTLAKLR